MKNVMVTICVILLSQILVSAQTENKISEQNENIVIKGTLSEIVNGKKVALPFANVFIDGTAEVTITDMDGGFNLISSNGTTCKVKCTYRGYEAFEKEIDLKSIDNITLDILLKPEGSAQKSNEGSNNS